MEGKLQTRKWQDKDGQDKYSTEVVAETMQMLGSRQGMGAATMVAAEATMRAHPAAEVVAERANRRA